MRSLIGKRIYIDTNAIIYFGEGRSIFGESARAVFQQAALGGMALVTSELTVAEVLVVPMRYSRDDLIAGGCDAFLTQDRDLQSLASTIRMVRLSEMDPASGPAS